MGTEKKHVGGARIHCRDDPNDTVQMIETTATRRHGLVSPTDDEPTSPRPSLVLPDELIVEILPRLPVRSLLRFRCVCKSWKTLISDPDFAKDYLRNSISDTSMTRQHVITSVIADGKCKLESFSVRSLFQNPSTPASASSCEMNHKYIILGSCNGFLCLYDYCNSYVRLWNPSTRLGSKESPTVFSPGGIARYAPISYHGFGYDRVNDKYKVLVFVGGVTKVYTFGANSWTTIQKFPYNAYMYLGIFVSGTLNWMATDQWVILSFDVEKETYGKVLLPPEQDYENFTNPILDILNNCLTVCFYCNKTHWEVWLMKEYGVGESWTKLTVVSHDKLHISCWIPQFNPWGNIPPPLCFLENGVLLARLLNYPRTWRERGLNFYIYHESLVSP